LDSPVRRLGPGRIDRSGGVPLFLSNEDFLIDSWKDNIATCLLRNPAVFLDDEQFDLSS
jgi:hypothetical protein